MVTPRYEYRAFAPSFGLVAERLRRRGRRRDVVDSDEVYLIARDGPDANVKLRDGRLQIKRLIDRVDGLERWTPDADEAFPLRPAFVHETLLPALGLAGSALTGPLPDRVDAAALLEAVARRDAGPWPASVCKRRFRLDLDEGPAEIDELQINRAAIGSLAAESEDPQALRALCAAIGLDAYPNLSVPRAIRCVMGLEAWPSDATG